MSEGGRKPKDSTGGTLSSLLWERLVGAADEDVLEDEGGNGGTNEGAYPVDPLVGPRPADERRAEGDRRVHGSACEGASGEDVGSHYEADCQRGDRA
uniref:Uncharacterized protein n=1 Tax=Nymphaea colorata TaxID=210225 RepID=A0A5K1CQ96_9MAGN